VSVVIRELVHVSANLRLDGGGAAHLGRVIGRAMRRYCSLHGIAFRGLHLPTSDGHPALDGYASFGGSQARLAAALLRLQIAGAGRRALLFDHAGPARAQAYLPTMRRSRYAVFLLGIEAWRPLERDRRRGLATAFRLLPISQTTLERARPFLPTTENAQIVHPGLEPASGAGHPDAACLSRVGRGFVLTVSRLSAREGYKGQRELIEVWPALQASHPEARLVIVGDGDERPALEERIRSLGLEGSIVLTGFVAPATLAALYRRAALFAMPSREEGFGLVFLEAMAAARPCVALADTAPAEIVVEGVTGLLVDASNSGSLTAALAGLLADPERAATMGAAGLERYLEHFTFEQFERRFAPTLDEIVAGRSR